MSFTTESFKIPDAATPCFRIRINGKLTMDDSIELRELIASALKTDYNNIYIDGADVIESDLSGVNEVINSHYLLEKASKKLTFVYRRNSSLEKWVLSTGLDKFIDTAIVPA